VLRITSCVLLLGAILLASGVEAQDPKKDKKETPKKETPKKAQPKKGPGQATPAEDLHTVPGFKVELIHSSDSANEGSWINLAKDGKGRLIIGGQRGQSSLRFTIENGKVAKKEKLQIPVTEVMGILWAFDSLYLNGFGPQGFGLYRCKETSESGNFDDIKFLKKFEGAGEHGPHGLAMGPDNKIYIINGNHTKLPEGLSKTSAHKNFQEDHLLPRQWDGNGHATGILAPGGYVVRTDADGNDWELMLAGYRNAYDIAFNGDGEYFTFDSDMEWDWGMPWYRPTRVNHNVSGAEFGWRSGTGKWPTYYPDSLPATVDIGVGSPTGVANGIGAKFPAKYQKAIYVLDWSYGRLIAVHLTPKGSSYSATWENLVCPKALVDNKVAKKPLNLTDAIIGDDGAMYFTTGGRNNQSGLYRVTYTGSESTAPAELKNSDGAKERALRHSLEAFHGKVDPAAVSVAWPHLSSADRFLSGAARVALESQPVSTWKEKALNETNAQAALNALVALARSGDRKDQPELLNALKKFPISKLSEALQLEKLRLIQLAITRLGPPAGPQAVQLIQELDEIFPNTSEFVNREASQVLIYLQSPTVLSKSLTLIKNAKTQEDRFHYLFHLRTLPFGYWTLDQRKEYLAAFTVDRSKLAHPPELMKWFEEAGRPYSDGSSFNNFIKNILREFSSNLADSERKLLEPMIVAINKDATVNVQPNPRKLVKEWKLEELVTQLDKADKGRSFEKGRQAYIDASCAKCHRFGDFGGAVGPDLTAVASRFDRRTLLESIVEPSKVISEQYENVEVDTADGRKVIGRVVDENATSISIQPDPLDVKRVVIKKADIDSRKPSKISPMPGHLIDVLPADEIFDLLAFMESMGRKQHPAFKK
jgi:putative heme-binding domain-containing protein